jgi:hypothetical protein
MVERSIQAPSFPDPAALLDLDAARGRNTAAGAKNDRRRGSEIDHRRWRSRARARVDDRVDPIPDARSDRWRVVQRVVGARQDQRRRHDRLFEFVEQGSHDRMIGHAYADGAAPRMLHPSRHFRGRAQQEREWPRRSATHDVELRVVHPREAADLREVTANERQVVPLVDAAQRANPLGRGRIAHAASERVARVGRIRDDTAAAQHLRGAANEPRLWMCRMKMQQQRHEFAASPCAAQPLTATAYL